MDNEYTSEQTAEVDAFAAAERALSEAGIGFIVVEEQIRPSTEHPHPLAA